jgi:hypothetical protein
VGEKGNLVATGEGVVANVAERSPEIYLGYKQLEETRAGRSPAHATDGEADAQDSATQPPASPAGE